MIISEVGSLIFLVVMKWTLEFLFKLLYTWCYSYFLCGFVVFYYWPFHVKSCLALCSRVLSVLFDIVITSLREERAGICASSICTRSILSVFSSSWCQGLATTCACGTPCTFQLPFLYRPCCALTFHWWCLEQDVEFYCITALSVCVQLHVRHILSSMSRNF